MGSAASREASRTSLSFPAREAAATIGPPQSRRQRAKSGTALLPSNAVPLGRKRDRIGSFASQEMGPIEIAMAEIQNTTDSAQPVDDRLNSWKEIAVYLKRDVTTVQRWERREGMPIHRHLHDRMGSVYAFRAELDDWARSRTLRPTPENVPENETPAENGKPGPNSLSDEKSPASAPSPTRLALLLLPAIVAVGATHRRLPPLTESRVFLEKPHRRCPGSNRRRVRRRRPLRRRSHMTAILWRFFPTAMAKPTSGSCRSVPAHFTISPKAHPRTRQSIHSNPRFLARRLSGHVLGSQAMAAPFGPTTSAFGPRQLLGGPPKPYLEGVAEFDWSHDGSRLAYHTPAAGDPLFVSDGNVRGPAPLRFSPRPQASIPTFPSGLPTPLSSTSSAGELPDKLDIWRIKSVRRPAGTHHFAKRTCRLSRFPRSSNLLYLANDSGRTGPGFTAWSRTPHSTPAWTLASIATHLWPPAPTVTVCCSRSRAPRVLFGAFKFLPRSARSQLPLDRISQQRTTQVSPRDSVPAIFSTFPRAARDESIWKLSNGVET